MGVKEERNTRETNRGSLEIMHAFAGPTEESNWVIKDRLLVGAYPSSVYDDANARILSGILKLGITTFVCLQQE